MVRHHPQWRRAREIVRSGAIGEVGAIQTLFAYRLLDPANIRNRPPGGGGLYDIGCYAILTARYIFGAEPSRVVAALDIDPNFGTDRLASAVLEFPGGRHLTFTAGTQLAGASARHHRGRRRAGSRSRSRSTRRSTGRRESSIDSGADLVGGGRAERGIPDLRSIYAAGRRLLARRPRRGAAGVSARGRHRQHAGDRRLFPLGAKRSVGEPLRGRVGASAAIGTRNLTLYKTSP